MRQFLSLFTLSLCFSCLLGCAPRGESKTIEELVAVAQSRIAEAEVKGEGQVSEAVSELTTSLQNILTTAESSATIEGKALASISEMIRMLIPKAGVTSRASLSELSKQYQILGSGASVGSDQAKLLVARTLHTVASELETTKFSL